MNFLISSKYRIIILFGILICLSIFFFATHSDIWVGKDTARPEENPLPQFEEYSIKPNDSIFNILNDRGMDSSGILQFVGGAKKTFDLTKINPAVTIKLDI